MNRIVTVTNNNLKKGQIRTAGDADAEFGAPMKKRRRLERDKALPFVCDLELFRNWEALDNKKGMVYGSRFYVKGVKYMEEKLLTHMVC